MNFYTYTTTNLLICYTVPTFVDFLLAFESQKEVREYIHMYLGNTQEANNFASEFIERRSRLFSADQLLARPEPPAPTHSNHFQEVKVSLPSILPKATVLYYKHYFFTAKFTWYIIVIDYSLPFINCVWEWSYSNLKF